MDFSGGETRLSLTNQNSLLPGFHWLTQGHVSSTGPMKVKPRLWAGLMGKLCDSELLEYRASWIPRREVNENKRGMTSNLDILTTLNFFDPAMPDTLSSGFTEWSQYIFLKGYFATEQLLL